MAMTTTLLVATGFAALNAVFLTVLTVVWARNYRTFGSDLTAGLVVFAGVMLLENLVAIYFFFSMGMLYGSSQTAQQSVVVLRALQTVALAFLTYVTMQ